MLNLIMYVINFVKQLCYFGLVVSYKAGQLIVYGTKALIHSIICLHENVGSILKILFEDFLVFLSDVGQRLLVILTVIYNMCESVFSFITLITESIKYVITTVIGVITGTYNAIITIIEKTFLAFAQLLVMIKLFIALIGSGIWFSITIIPGLIFYTCTMSTYYIGSLIEELYNFTVYNIIRLKLLGKMIYIFLTDTPLESLAGLTVGVCISYLILKHRVILYNKLTSNLELMRQTLHRICLRLSFSEVVFVDHLGTEHEPSDTSVETSEESEESSDETAEPNCGNTERLCLICQERVKSIVLLPCRHVCLCNVCNLRLRDYNRSCPLCRTFVRKTMKVYV